MATAAVRPVGQVPENSCPERRGHAEWIGGRPTAVLGMDGGGAADLIEAVEDEAAGLAGQMAEVWWDQSKNGRRAELQAALAEKLARVDGEPERGSGHVRTHAELVADVFSVERTRAEALRDCHHAGDLQLYADGVVRARTEFRCKQIRLCPWCAHEEAARRVRRLKAVTESANPKRLQFCTLTMANVSQGRLAAGEAAFWAAWEKLRRRKGWASGVVGYVASMECTWNTRMNTFHVHLHVALEARDTWAGGFSWARVQRDWQSLTGAPVVDFRPLDGIGGLLEATKYVSKLKASGQLAADGTGGGLLDMPDAALAEWLTVFNRPKHLMWRVYGEWRRRVAAQDAADKEARRVAGEARDAVEPVARFAWDERHPRALVLLIPPDVSTDLGWSDTARRVAAAIEKYREKLRAAAARREKERRREERAKREVKRARRAVRPAA